MGKNIYINIIATIALIVGIIIGIAFVRSVDQARYKMEDVYNRLYNVGSRLMELEKKVDDLTKMEFKVANAVVQNKPVEKIVNQEFYDQDADIGGRYVMPITSASKNLNSLINNDHLVSILWDKCTSSLAARNYEFPEKFEPLMAESWEISEDKMTYTIKLREGILWHDFTDPVSGKEWTDVEVTAEDFKFYLDVVKNEDVDCAPLRSYFQDLDRIEVISKYEFKVHWKKKYFLSEIWTLGLTPLPRHLYHAYDGPFDGKKFNDDFERNKIIVGCGPYRFDRWDTGQSIVLKRWGKYFGTKYGIAPPIDKIVFEIIKHPSTQFQALVAGDIDKMGLTSEQWINKTDAPEFDPDSPEYKIRKFKYPSRSYSYIGYNLKNPLFQDKRVRQAMTHLVDREKILDLVFHDLGRIITGNFFIDSPYYDESIEPYPFSILKAKELLKEAGWEDADGDGILDKDGLKFEFTVLTISNSPWQEKMFPIIKEDMKKAGIVMKINKVEWSVYIQRLEKKNFEVISLGWSLGFESDPTQIWHSSMADEDGSSNHIGFNNKRADEIIEKIRTCFDFDERVKLCHEFHQIVHEEQPYTFLFTRDSLVALNNRYENVKLFDKIPSIPQEIMWVPRDTQEKVRLKK